MTESRLAEIVAWVTDLTDSIPAGVPQDRAEAARQFLGPLFLPAPRVEVSQAKIALFEGLFDGHLSRAGWAGNPDLAYSWPYPKWEFLRYLTSTRGVLLHGSNEPHSELKPRPQTDWSGKPVEAVFATADPIWAIFFATLDRGKCVGSIRNGGFLVESPGGALERFYFFSVDETNRDVELLTNGFVHVVPSDGFATLRTPVRFDEWHNPSPVPVLARVAVGPEDFPFRDAITRHGSESVFASQLQYRARLGSTSYGGILLNQQA